MFEPTRTTVSPVMVPSMMTILALLPEVAATRASRVDTRVTGPPTPPVVLDSGYESVRWSSSAMSTYPAA